MTDRMAFRSNHEWSAANGDELFGGFARVLKYGCSGVVYRDNAVVRATARSRFQTTSDPRLAPLIPPKVTSGEGKPRWTQERIDALPRTSGSLTRIGDALVRDRNGNPAVKCLCSGGSARCRRETVVAAPLWANAGRRPQSCQQCASKRKGRGYTVAITEKGYAHARDFASKERENQKAQEGEAA